MSRLLNRRGFLVTSSAATAAVPRLVVGQSAQTKPFSFVLLGDLHFDKLEHHDFEWLAKKHPDSLSQIENYSRITTEIMPLFFDTIQKSVAESQAEFVLQVGDFVQGLCGSEQLSVAQNQEALAFVDGKQLGVPFLFTKGNHEITGDGAVEAFNHVFLPFLSQQMVGFHGSETALQQASYAIEHRDALLCFYDAYDRSSLEWLEAALAKRSARHCFVIIHPPVVPYGARANWHIFASERDRAKREKLLTLLGKNNAMVLGGHIHRFNAICRETMGGRFAQLAISSVVSHVKPVAATELEGLSEYNGDQIRVEPNFSPSTAAERRKIYDVEAPLVRAFSYANLPGHAVVTMDGASVQATLYSGISRDVYRTVHLTKLLET